MGSFFARILMFVGVTLLPYALASGSLRFITMSSALLVTGARYGAPVLEVP